MSKYKRQFKERKDQWYKQLTHDLIVKSDTLIGPRGGEWHIDYLYDGRIGLKGPWSKLPKPHEAVPKWIMDFVPTGHRLRNVGGTTFRQRRYLSEVDSDAS